MNAADRAPLSPEAAAALAAGLESARSRPLVDLGSFVDEEEKLENPSDANPAAEIFAAVRRIHEKALIEKASREIHADPAMYALMTELVSPGEIEDRKAILKHLDVIEADRDRYRAALCDLVAALRFRDGDLADTWVPFTKAREVLK